MTRQASIWLAIILGSIASAAFLWFSTVPLGIPHEWTWERSAIEPDLIWNLSGGAVAAGLYLTLILLGRRRLEELESRPRIRMEVGIWLIGLAAAGFAWMWIVQEISPIKSRLGKAAFVLYYPSSSGYFTRARYEEPSARSLLTGYEDLMREGDVLHTGTHPPGLFLVFHGMIALCDSSSRLSAILDATQPASFRGALDVIAVNAMRGRTPKPLHPIDRRVLWLATCVVMLSASLTVIPLFGLLCRTYSLSTAWTCASLWPTVPAVAIFVPKSDAAFPLISTGLMWLWLTAWDRRSITFALATGFVAWVGLMCSLAFLPVILAAGVGTIGKAIVQSMTSGMTVASVESLMRPTAAIGLRRLLCIIGGFLGVGIPNLILWCSTHVNMWNVWFWNYRNHAGFYQQYSRTYWKWLLVNPLEVSFAAGWPLTLLGIIGGLSVFYGVFRQNYLTVWSSRFSDLISIILVWGLLWVTGKNSGEAARLWILLLPWMIWASGLAFDLMIANASSRVIRNRSALCLLVIQFAICLLTVARVNGFQFETG